MNIRETIKKYLPMVPAMLMLLPAFISHSCANTTTPPSGGPKDTIPPVIVGLNPLPGTVDVPVHGARITFTFNEYVTVKDPKSIFLSPPLSKPPKYRIRGKSLVVYFEEDLQPNTTYTLDLTNAVADNNEGNMFPGYTMTFSTGPRIDSMVVTGTVLDCSRSRELRSCSTRTWRTRRSSCTGRTPQ